MTTRREAQEAGHARYTYRLRVSPSTRSALLAEWDRCRWIWSECVAKSKATHLHNKTTGEKRTCGPAQLDKMLPPEFKVRRQMTVILDRHNGPEPDISVIRAEACTGPDQMSYQARDVLLAVEVVSPDSELRDRTTKPQKYAAAGIPHFWLVHMAGQDGHPAVQVYERGEATGTYALTGIYHDHVKISVPYDIDLTAVAKL